jgi:hypothetical protein
MSQFPREYCMKITSALMEEAINQAKDSAPSVFSIGEYCMKITRALMQEPMNQANDSAPAVFSISEYDTYIKLVDPAYGMLALFSRVHRISKTIYKARCRIFVRISVEA